MVFTGTRWGSWVPRAGAILAAAVAFSLVCVCSWSWSVRGGFVVFSRYAFGFGRLAVVSSFWFFALRAWRWFRSCRGGFVFPVWPLDSYIDHFSKHLCFRCSETVAHQTRNSRRVLTARRVYFSAKGPAGRSRPSRPRFKGPALPPLAIRGPPKKWGPHYVL